jgi:hypothetical protein
MQAIRTRYQCPTNTRGSRVSAKCEAGQISIPWDDALNPEENHKAACNALRAKLGWNTEHYGDMVGGEFDGCWYWVFDDKRLQSLRAIVNEKRDGGLSGNPYASAAFKKGLLTIGRAYGFHGEWGEAPTRDEEIAAFLARNK